jgi:cell division septation protein DedD
MPHDSAEDGFHEIQLSGKQLVFLFMATTVVSVVIFLCGVLVGRGVRGDTVNAAETPTAAAPTAANTPPPEPANPVPTGEPRTPGAKDYTYSSRLEGEKPVKETLKTASEAKAPAEEPKPAADLAPAPAASTPPPPAPPAAPQTAPATRTPAAAPSATPSQSARPGTWAVQVVALTDRAAATAVVQRLAGKGYPAFLVTPQAGAPVQNYKVQVGRYADRAEAEQIKNRLKKEEQFEPWILR